MPAVAYIRNGKVIPIRALTGEPSLGQVAPDKDTDQETDKEEAPK